MKSQYFLITLIILFACKAPVPTEFEKSLLENYQKYENSEFYFRNGPNYFEIHGWDLSRLTDTLSIVNENLFGNTNESASLNLELTSWLKDSVFIGLNEKAEGQILFDTTNMMHLENSFDYYMSPEINVDHRVYRRIFQVENSSFEAQINKSQIFFRIIPMNGKRLETLGEYKIVTTGDYIPQIMNVSSSVSQASLKYVKASYSVDWFILIQVYGNDKKNLALLISENTDFYYEHLSSVYN